MSAKATIKVGNKESDRLSNAGSSQVFKLNKEREEVAKAFEDESVIEAVREYIFSKDPEVANPLQEIRDANL